VASDRRALHREHDAARWQARMTLPVRARLRRPGRLPLHQLAALTEITGAGGRHHVPGFRGGIPHDAAQELQNEILKTVRRSLATATIHHGSW
jgi:hypothetical protein